VSVLARRCGIKPATVSLHLRQLTSRVINDKPGFDLLSVVDRKTLSDLRLRHVFLTERGRRLAARMEKVMKDNPRKRIAPMGDLLFEDELQGFIRAEEASDASHSQ
jgi:DNA-binding MarR family transcriptional regulator